MRIASSSVSSNVGAMLQCSVVVMAIVALSPVPLTLPSGIAVALIGITGAALLFARGAVVNRQAALALTPAKKI